MKYHIIAVSSYVCVLEGRPLLNNTANENNHNKVTPPASLALLVFKTHVASISSSESVSDTSLHGGPILTGN